MSATITSNEVAHEYAYAWTGTAGKSASVLTRDGIEVRRNLAAQPGFEVDATGISTSGFTASTYAWTGTAGESASTWTRNGTVRTNLFPSPRGATLTNWDTAGYATGGVGSMRATGSGLETAWTTAPTGGGHSQRHTYQGTLAAGKPYYLSASVFTEKATTVLLIVDGTQVASIATRGNPYAIRVAGTFTPSADKTNPVIEFRVPDATGQTRFITDQVLLEQSTANGPYWDGSFAATNDGTQLTRDTTVALSGVASGRWRVRSSSQPNNVSVSSPYMVEDFAVQPDADYMVSLWISVPVAPPYPVRLIVTDTATGYRAETSYVELTDRTTGWQRIVIPWHTRVDSSSLQLALWSNATWSGTIDFSVYLDSILVETGGVELPYFDGSTANYVEFETTRPDQVDGWTEAADGLNIVNDVVGGGVDVVLREATLRRGSFTLVYLDESEAAFAFAMHRRPSTFTISESDRASIDMTYVVDGRLERALDDELRQVWLVRIEYQEVER